MPKWTEADIPNLDGKVAIVTGANSGLGLESARVLAKHGAHVIMACRDTRKAETAKAGISEAGFEDRLEIRELDLSRLASVRAFADGIKQDYEKLDILMLNAGIMALPRKVTEDGFEQQFGVNHLAHFALTGLLLPLLEASPEARVVAVTSIASFMGKLEFDDLMGERRFSRYDAYGQSKLANMVFIRELDRRLKQAGSSITAVAAHPGYTATNLQHTTRGQSPNPIERIVYPISNANLAMRVEKGALPQLYAAVAPDVEGGAKYGPDGLFQGWGYPTKCKQARRAHSENDGRRLWDVSEALTGVHYEFRKPATA